MGRRLQVLMLAVVASGAGLAGCANSKQPLSGPEYKARLAAIGEESDAAQQAVQRGLGAGTITELNAALETFATAEEKIAKELADLAPPKDAEAASHELVQGTHDTVLAVHDLIERVSKQSTVQAATGLLGKSSAAVKAGMEIDDALAKLKSLGYTKGS